MRTFGIFREAGSGTEWFGEVLGQAVRRLRGPFWDNPDAETETLVALENLTICVPSEPSKIIAVGRNYHAHAAERGEVAPKSPLTWLKAPSSLAAHENFIEIPHPDHRTDFEAELTIVISKRCKNVVAQDALGCVFGYTIALDISDRDVQEAEKQFARAKGFDTFTPVGPFIYADADAADLPISLRQNGELRQDARTSEMIFKPAELVSFISQSTTLLPGDLILTGTPAGVGPIKDGDTLETVIGPFAPLIMHVRNA